jgi:hypothetical protein
METKQIELDQEAAELMEIFCELQRQLIKREDEGDLEILSPQEVMKDALRTNIQTLSWNLARVFHREELGMSEKEYSQYRYEEANQKEVMAAYERFLQNLLESTGAEQKLAQHDSAAHYLLGYSSIRSEMRDRVRSLREIEGMTTKEVKDEIARIASS